VCFVFLNHEGHQGGTRVTKEYSMMWGRKGVRGVFLNHEGHQGGTRGTKEYSMMWGHKGAFLCFLTTKDTKARIVCAPLKECNNYRCLFTVFST
jgi:hypothetical protein